MDKLIAELEEKEQWYYDQHVFLGQRLVTSIEIAKGNIVADCIQLVKEHTKDHVLVPIAPTDEIENAMVDYLLDRLGPDSPYIDVEGLYKAMITKESNDA